MQPSMITIPADRLGIRPRANLEDPLGARAAEPSVIGGVGVGGEVPSRVSEPQPKTEVLLYDQARELALSWLRGERALEPGALTALSKLGEGRAEPDFVIVVRDVGRVSKVRDELVRLVSGVSGMREGPPVDLFSLTGTREDFNLRNLVAGLRWLNIWAKAVIHPHADDAAGIVWRVFYREPAERT